MKIALLTDGIYPFVIGGMQRHSYFLAKYLAKKKVFVRVYHCIKLEYAKNYDEILKQVFTEEELSYLEFIIIPFDFSSKFPGYYILESYRYSQRIYEHLIKDIEQFDFIYSKGFTAWYLLMKKNNRFPKIGVKLHGYEMYQYAMDFKTKLQHLLLRIPAGYVTKHSDVVFSYGGKITDILRKQLKVSDDKIIEVPAGIEQTLIKNKVTDIHPVVTFAFVGRYEKRKGIEPLNESIRQLLKNGLKFQFHFIGDIPEDKQVKDKQIIYHGKMNRYESISEVLQACDVLICPSFSEGMPNVILEAMANGLTVAATDVGAVQLLVNEHTGYLMKNNSVNVITETMRRIISEKKEVLQSKKEAALSHVQNFVWGKIVDDYLSKIKRFLLPH